MISYSSHVQRNGMYNHAEIKCNTCREEFSTKGSLKLHPCLAVSDESDLAVSM